MERSLPRIRALLVEAKPFARPQPATGRLWLDVAWLLVVGAFHYTILPAIVGSFLLVDLMTPWLVVTFVASRLPRATLLGLVGALVVETHSTAPAGLYLCAYWVIATVLWAFKSALSWRHVLPWVAAFACCEAWVVAFESLVVSVNRGDLASGFGGLSWLVVQATRVLAATGIGLLLAWPFISRGLPEEAA
jgi:hypothetical protein